MAGRARLVAQGVALAGVVALLGLLVWKVAFEDTGGAAARLERGERPAAPDFTLERLDRAGTLTLSSLRGIGYGAAAMPVEILRSAIKRFGPIVYSGFGMTELGGNVLTFPKTAHERAVNGDEHLLASCGTPMAGPTEPPG